ncbi:RagB/SusD family nutrient uptake outer membrane protein [Winogradskyella vidalii]|uniref:RagB/SusD family nutrient uptake outer membrane protein n=1 Tax=Winogradskyella vidalii TaxID=2615024 RepID=UPI001FE62AA2|nr:RagB/SusD family nutrient uptake outer membrane protein [Winogradskyella vidalii]
MTQYIRNQFNDKIVCLVACLMLLTCEDFIEVDSPRGQISKEVVFEDESTVNAAVSTVYAKLRDEVLLTGNLYGMNVLMGFYSDEVDYYSDINSDIYPFYSHEIIANNSVVNTVWSGGYEVIYMTNLLLEGIEDSTGLNSTIKEELKGELLFLRALAHFYLVNLFNDIPYIETTDYLINQDVARISKDLVYDHILEDLLQAKLLLESADVSGERIRANGFVVSAFLARIYLYLERWEDAVNESSLIINTTDLFHLESVEDAFLKNSSSAILQLKPKNAGDNTNEAISFYFIFGPPYLMSLNPSLVSSFEASDLRLQHWIRTVTNGSENWYAPFKYKQIENTGTSLEYSIVFRLAEQYLIRSEARMRLGNTELAEQDLNIVRARAGLEAYAGLSTVELSNAILEERRHELFTEFGHRWFDLKRFGEAENVLINVKPNWQSRDHWLPIPELELLMNPNLLPQNTGY